MQDLYKNYRVNGGAQQLRTTSLAINYQAGVTVNEQMQSFIFIGTTF